MDVKGILNEIRHLFDVRTFLQELIYPNPANFCTDGKCQVFTG